MLVEESIGIKRSRQNEDIPTLNLQNSKLKRNQCYCRHVVCDGLRLDDDRTPFVARSTRNIHERKINNHEMCPLQCPKCKEHLLDPSKKLEGVVTPKTHEMCCHAGCFLTFARESSKKRHELNSSLHKYCQVNCKGCEIILESERNRREETEQSLNKFREYIAEGVHNFDGFLRETFEESNSSRNIEKDRFYVIDISTSRVASLKDVLLQRIEDKTDPS